MTSIQKIIKYCSIAFAIFLTITIISTLLTASYYILDSIGIINSNENVISENFIKLSDEVENISSLKIELKDTTLQIRNSDKFEVKTNNSIIKYYNENGNIIIKDKSEKWLFKESNEGKIIIYLPEDTKLLDEVNIDVDAGIVSIDNLYTRKLDLDLGTGEMMVDSLIVSDETKISGGAGEINIKSGKINNIDLDLGIGEAHINSNITGNSKINTGIGELNLILTSSLENYRMDFEKGIGKISLNGNSILDNVSVGTGENYIKISGGIGEIKIRTN